VEEFLGRSKPQVKIGRAELRGLGIGREIFKAPNPPSHNLRICSNPLRLRITQTTPKGREGIWNLTTLILEGFVKKKALLGN